MWAVVGATGLAAVGLSMAVTIPLALGAAAVVAVLVAGASSLPKRERTPRWPTRFNGYAWINVGQGGAVVIAVAVLASAGAIVLLAPVICLIVGVHFFPLARMFGQTQYWATGALLVVLAVVGVILVVNGATGEVVRIVVGFGAALVLWGTSVDVARRG
ncbi:MAG: hypothetical protein L0I24_00010 [Pseudonocardia sp.]|nr:hypothetical protein [Pseudonocardia sp.]